MSEAVFLAPCGAPRRLGTAVRAAPWPATRNMPAALVSFAMLLLERGHLQRAIELGQRAVGVDPNRMSAHHVLGQALCRAGDLVAGIASLQRAAALRGDAFDVQFHLGNALAEAGDLDVCRSASGESARARAKRRCSQLEPRQPVSPAGKAARPLPNTSRTIGLDPRLPQAYNNLGNVLSESGDADAAIGYFRQALALAPDGRPRGATCCWRSIERIACRREEFVAEHRAFGRYFAQRIAPLPPAGAETVEGRRLKIGYVSSDFASHAVAIFMRPFLAHHDRARVRDLLPPQRDLQRRNNRPPGATLRAFRADRESVGSGCRRIHPQRSRSISLSI